MSRFLCRQQSLLLTFVFSIRLIWLARRVNGAAVAALLTLFLILFPCGINFIYLSLPEYVHTLMRYSVVMFYVAVLVIWEKYKGSIFPKKLTAFTDWTILVLMAITISCFSFQANETYFCLQQNYTRTLNYYNTIVAQIKMTDGYTADMPVAFIGEVHDPTFPNSSEFRHLENLCGVFNGYDYVNLYSRNNLLRYFCGFNTPPYQL